MRINEKKHSNGFTLVEILVALGIFSFVASGVLSFSTWVIKSTQTESAKAERNIENLEMLKQLTQPIYFGALSKFSQNSELKSCMTVDQKNCDVAKEYKVIPMDLATNTPLNLVSSSKDSQVKNEITFKVHCPNKETSCDRAEYFTVKIKTYLNYHGFALAPVEKMGVVTPEFNNVVTFVPDATLAPGRPINVIIFLDNSNSMAFAKDQIKTALDSLLNKLSTMDATVGVYTLGSSYSGTSFDYVLDADGNKVPALPWSSRPGGYEYWTLETTKAYYYSPYTNQDPATLLAPYTSTRIFNFLTTDDGALRAKKVTAIKNLVEGLFSSPAYGKDTPLCSLLRFLEAPGNNPPFKFDAMTPTAFFIITNEDDETTADPMYAGGCGKSATIKWKTNVDYYHYMGYVQSFQITADLNATNDGAPFTAKYSFYYELPYDPALVENADCLADAQALPIALVEKAIFSQLSMYAYGYTYKAGDGFQIKGCTVKKKNFWISPSNTSPKDYCNQIAAGTYNVPKSYIPGSCYEIYSKGGSGASGGYIENVPLFSATVGIVDSVYNSLKSHVSLENLYYMPVIHPDVSTCTITPGSSVGTRYAQLAKKPGLQSSIIPVCSPSYTGQLDKLIQWTETLGANDISIPATVAANMNAVEIVRAGTKIPLVNLVDYNLSGTTLIFKTGLLQPNDIVKVYLK